VNALPYDDTDFAALFNEPKALRLKCLADRLDGSRLQLVTALEPGDRIGRGYNLPRKVFDLPTDRRARHLGLNGFHRPIKSLARRRNYRLV
jgi:hypothetical protein